jgi:hypothetical protein
MWSYLQEDAIRAWSYAYLTSIFIYSFICIFIHLYMYIFIYLFTQLKINKKQMARLWNYWRSTWTIDDKRLTLRNVHKWTSMHAFMHTCMHMHACMPVCMHVSACMRSYSWMWSYSQGDAIRAWSLWKLDLYIYIYIYIYIYTHILLY